MTSYSIDGSRLGQARQSLTGPDGKPLKQNEAATKLGIHAVTLNRIENNKAQVSLELLEKISELTGKSREYLLGEDEPVDPFEANRVRLALAIDQLAGGFEILNELMEQVGLTVAKPGIRSVA